LHFVWDAADRAWTHNAITRAAHRAPTERNWADDEAEEIASAALYARARVLAAIPDEDREELGW
jgi:hypothetical protein